MAQLLSSTKRFGLKASERMSKHRQFIQKIVLAVTVAFPFVIFLFYVSFEFKTGGSLR